jgi:tetratricopeptide (TPR) repeat protein
LRSAVAAHEGNVVDASTHQPGVLATFASSADAVAAAVAMQQGAHAIHIEIRVGVAVGDVSTAPDGTLTGPPLPEATALCAAAAANEILVAETVRELVRGRGGFAYESAGDLDLADVPDPVPACRVLWSPLTTSAPAAVPFPTTLLSGVTTAYVGRPALLDAITAQWRRAQAGTSGAVLLAGEPGVGKTRTSAEVAIAAHGDGALVLYGRCDEDLGAPYQPFVEALDWYTGAGRNDSDRRDIGTLGRLPGELTRLQPALATHVDELPPPLVADPASERHRLFEAVSSWLIDAAHEAGGMVLVLDDVHWATKPTLLLTLHVLRAASEAAVPLLVLITYRDTDIDRAHPLSKLLGDLRLVSERAPVDNLTEAEVVDLMAVSAGHDMDAAGRALGAAVYAETEGNPFFVAEVLRHLSETGAIGQVADRWQVAADMATLAIPEGVRDVVGRRVSRLSRNANEVLTTAAVQGREVEVAVLVALSDNDEAAVLDALDEAVRARLVEETDADRFRFAHALVRTTLYDELSAARRRRLHRRVADALEEMRPSDVVALAYHCAEAGPVGGDNSKALRYGLAAAEEALAARAFGDAEDRFLHVLDLLEEDDGADPSHRIAALCGLGESQRDQGNRDFRETLLDASRQAHALGNTGLLVRAVLANSRGMVSIVGGLDAERVEFIELALAAIDPAPSADRARLIAQLAAEVMFGGDHARRLALCDEAEAMAREVQDKAVLAWVLVRTGYAAVIPSRGKQLVGRTEEAMLLADATGDPSLRVYARALYMGALMFVGRLLDAVEVADDMVAIGDAECAPGERWVAHINSLPATYVRDGVMAAARRNDEALAMGQAAGEVDALQWWAAAAGGPYWLMAEGGDLADAAGVFAVQYPLSPVWFSGWAMTLVDGGRYDEARAVVEEHGLRNDALEDFSMPLTGTQQLAALCFELDDVEMARTVAPVLEKYLGCWPHYFLFPLSPASWGLAAALAVLGEHDRAVALFDDALAEVLGVRLFDHAAHCRIGLARVLLARNGDGDAARARELLAQARAHAESIPAPRLVARIDALLAP